MIDEALYRISTPKETIPSTVANRIQSVLSFCATLILRWQLIHNLFKDFAAVLETAELVEAGAGRCQQHGVSRPGFRIGPDDRIVESLGIHQPHRAAYLLRDLRRGGPNQQRGMGFGGERLAQLG